MKVVIAIDSLKGSLTSMEAGNAIREGILRVKKDVEICVEPLADGGEGTAEALVEGYNGTYISANVTGPLGKKVVATYGYLESTNTAVIEMAQAAGITLVSENERNPMISTTFGVGELIKDGISRGCRNFIIGIGGSATNDGGLGMLKSLGFDFLDKNGVSIRCGAQDLAKVTRIDDKNVIDELHECTFKVACDVKNPLCSKDGATYVYGAQKGILPENMQTIDESMLNYARVTSDYVGVDYTNFPGAGAAGGIGFAFKSYLNADLIPGIELIMGAINLQEKVKGADVVITGEGRLDIQTSMGKAPIGVAKLAKKYGAKVIAFAGSVSNDAKKCNESGIDAYFPITRGAISLEEAMKFEIAYSNMADTVEQVFRLL